MEWFGIYRQGLYGQGKSERKVSFSIRSGKVRETCNGQGEITLLYSRSGKWIRFEGSVVSNETQNENDENKNMVAI